MGQDKGTQTIVSDKIHEEREIVATLKLSHKEVLLGLKKEVGESRKSGRKKKAIVNGVFAQQRWDKLHTLKTVVDELCSELASEGVL